MVWAAVAAFTGPASVPRAIVPASAKTTPSRTTAPAAKLFPVRVTLIRIALALLASVCPPEQVPVAFALLRSPECSERDQSDGENNQSRVHVQQRRQGEGTHRSRIVEGAKERHPGA